MKKSIFILMFVCLFASFLQAEEEVKKKQTICVNMIVKDESRVITRCLSSVKPIIDYWVIVDTGSTDNTKEIIKDFMKDVPGELHETEWKNFGYNRNDAILKARGKADYILIIDADEVLSIPEGYKVPELDKDFYNITTKYGGSEYSRVQLVNNHIDWCWKGVLHEYLECPNAQTSGHIQGIYNLVNTDGARSTDPLKYQKDAELLEKALLEDPTNTRYVFYLAQSYRDHGNHEKALENYKKRAAMGGWDQEVYWSMLRIAQMQEALNQPKEEVIKSYYDAFQYRNSRAEALYYLAAYYRSNNDYAASYLIANQGRSMPVSKDGLFLEKWIHDWGLTFEQSISAYWLGKYEEAQQLNSLLLSNKDTPQAVREAVERNAGFVRAKVLEFFAQVTESKEAA